MTSNYQCTIVQGSIIYFIKHENKTERDREINLYYQSKSKSYQSQNKTDCEQLKEQEWQLFEQQINNHNYYGFVHQNIIHLKQLLQVLMNVNQNIQNAEREKKVDKNIEKEKESLIALLNNLFINIIEEFITLRLSEKNLGHFNINEENILVSFQKPSIYNTNTFVKLQIIFINFDQSEKVETIEAKEGFQQDLTQILQILQKIYQISPNFKENNLQEIKKCKTKYQFQKLIEELKIEKKNKIISFQTIGKWSQNLLDELNKIFNQKIDENVNYPISLLNGILLQNQYLQQQTKQLENGQNNLQIHQELTKLIKQKQFQFTNQIDKSISEAQENLEKNFKFQIQFDELQKYKTIFKDNLLIALIEFSNFNINAQYQIQNKIIEVYDNSVQQFQNLLDEFFSLELYLELIKLIKSLI